VHLVSKNSAPESTPFNHPLRATGNAAGSFDYWSALYPENDTARILDQMMSREIPKERGDQQLLEVAENSFREKGIRTERVTRKDGSTYLRLLPERKVDSDDAHLLNRLAAGIQKYDPRFELLYDPKDLPADLSKVRAYVGFDETDQHPFINIGHTAMIERSAKDPSLVHEVLHARIFGHENQGIFHALMIRIRRTDPQRRSILARRGVIPGEDLKSTGYKDFYRTDELFTHRYNLSHSVREYVRAVRENSKDRGRRSAALVVDFANVVSLADSAIETGRTVHTGLQSMGNQRLAWNRAVRFKAQGKDYQFICQQITMDGRAYAQISFEEIPGLLNVSRELVSFQTLIPVSGQPEAVPSELFQRYFSDLSEAGKSLRESAIPVLASQMIDADPNMPAAQKEKLFQMMLTSTSQNKPLPGYPSARVRKASPPRPERTP
jgi:hypothetical protein